ncbi:uncharacterized protein [Rutidosis leptorrhynchoides]|uniref:uncharacterized protein n=1 Tax=Rutidosis leptorrhynchoides TaxID=125765 RepID=UPI003A99A95A
MRLASWNTRGLGTKSRGRMAGSLVNRFQLQFLAIQETMVKVVSQPILNEIWRHFAFESIQAEANGRSGGMLSIWRVDFFSLIQHWIRKYWIATILRYIPNNQIVLIVNVYAPQQELKKKFVWSQLSSIARMWPGPLCFLGANQGKEVASDRGILCKQGANQGKEVASDRGILYKQGPQGKLSRIDRFLINSVWAQLWPDTILQTDLPDWFVELCENHWNNYNVQGWAAFIIGKKLRLLKADLKSWKSTLQTQDEFTIKQCELEIQRLKYCYKFRDLLDTEAADLAALKQRKKRFNIRLESKRRLHSRFHWLKLGDKNTRFFHLISRIKQQSSYIAASNSLSEVIDVDWDTLNLAQVTVSIRESLEAHFTASEVSNVIKGFDGNKAPGPDGFSLQFFKKGWHFLEDNIMDMFFQFHEYPSFPKGFNSSFIVLIPKSNSARNIEHLRPVSLINAPYKILAKTLANRLKVAIPSIISENQNGFVPSRLLMDGVMVVNEVVHLAKKKKSPILLLKIDFSKAYDCISHEFLITVLHKMGFGSKFISWVETCISKIHFSVLLNGSPSREGIMKRGLRQGDPLSSSLFIIVSEILSKLLSRDLSNGLLEGCKFGHDLVINHSQFADDTIIFAQPNFRELNRIKYIMGIFLPFIRVTNECHQDHFIWYPCL